MLQIVAQRPVLFWIVIALVALLIISASAGTIWALHYAKDERIADGVWAGPWELGGLTRTQASELIEVNFGAVKNKPILLEYMGRKWSILPVDVGMRLNKDNVVDAAYAIGHTGNIWRKISERRQAAQKPIYLELPLTVNNDKLLAYLSVLKSEIDRPAMNAWLTWKPKAAVQITPHQTGRVLELNKLAGQISAVTLRDRNRRIYLPVQQIKPDITYDELAAFNFKNVVAQYTTVFDPKNVDRSHNVAIAAQAIDKVLLRPGDIFSFNEKVGLRVAEKGYREAPVLVADELVPGVGGGVCQVSTTLYNAVLLADMRIVKRTNHSRPVAYVPLGQDATVADNYIDFQFMNNTIQPLYLISEVSGKKLTVRLLGPGPLGSDQSKKKVKITSNVIQEIPFGELVETDPTLPPGERRVEKAGGLGYRMELWRQVTIEDVTVKKELLARFQYRSAASLIKVGPENENRNVQ